MKVVITDANIFMHIIGAGLIDEFFRLELEVLTTSEVFTEIGDERHLLEPFIGAGFDVIQSDEDQIESIESAPYPPGLSFPDRSVLFHATLRQCTVLTGEALMRRECKKHGLEVHGILWVLDRMASESLCTTHTLAQTLTRLMRLPDFRVPKSECEARLRDWKS